MDHDPNMLLWFGKRDAASLANACRQPQEIDYICSYGPGHPILDVAEVKMIRRVFGAVAETVPISSIRE